jgi:hypothetical protein
MTPLNLDPLQRTNDYIKTSLFISLCTLRDLPQQKISRELCSGGDPPIFLGSYVPMERFFDGRIMKTRKHKSGKFKKTSRKEWRKEKEEIF